MDESRSSSRVSDASGSPALLRITCLGDCLIDFLPMSDPADEGGLTTGFRMAVGGSMLNVAVGLARLGQPVAFAGKIADDFFGHRISATIAAEGIDQRYLVRAPGHSTLAFAAFEGGEPSFTFYGEGAADTLLRADELALALFEETRILFTGSTSLLRGDIPATILTTLRRLRGRALLALDPNIRPTLVRDEGAYRALLDELFGLVDLVKVSAADLAWLAPGEPIEAVAERILRRGPALVVVTRGAEGASAHSRSGARAWSPAIPVEVVDTVGAGDAFSAALLCWLAERDLTTQDALLALDEARLADSLRWATAGAAANCARHGANPPTRTELEQVVARSPSG